MKEKDSPYRVGEGWLDDPLMEFPRATFRYVAPEEPGGYARPPDPQDRERWRLWDAEASGRADPVAFCPVRAEAPRTLREAKTLHRRFAELDIRDVAAITAFARRFGFLNGFPPDEDDGLGVRYGEHLWNWTYEITRMRFAIGLVEALRGVSTPKEEERAARRISALAWGTELSPAVGTPMYFARHDQWFEAADMYVFSDETLARLEAIRAEDPVDREAEAAETARLAGITRALQGESHLDEGAPYLPLRPFTLFAPGTCPFCPEMVWSGIGLMLVPHAKEARMVLPIPDGLRLHDASQDRGTTFGGYVARSRRFLNGLMENLAYGDMRWRYDVMEGSVEFEPITLLQSLWGLLARDATRRDVRAPRACRGCGRSFVPRRKDQRYCLRPVVRHDGTRGLSTDACRQAERRLRARGEEPPAG